MSRGDEVTMLVADVTDAFWLIPMHEAEQKYFVAKLRGKYTMCSQGQHKDHVELLWHLQQSCQLLLHGWHHLSLRRAPGLCWRPTCYVAQWKNCRGWLVWWLQCGASWASSLPHTKQCFRRHWSGLVWNLKYKNTRSSRKCQLQRWQNLTSVWKKPRSQTWSARSRFAHWLAKRWPLLQCFSSGGRSSASSTWLCKLSKPMRQMGEFGRSKLHTLCNGCEPSLLERKLASSDATLWGPSATRAPKSSSHGMRRHLAWEVHSKYKAPLWTREFFAARITEDDEIHLGAKLESHEGRQTWEALCGLVCLRPWRANWQSSRAHCMHRSKASQLPGNLPWTLDVPNTVQQWWNICLVLQTPSATCFHVGISLECYSSFPSSWKAPKQLSLHPGPNRWKTLSWGAASPAQPCAAPMGDTKLSTPMGSTKRRKLSKKWRRPTSQKRETLCQWTLIMPPESKTCLHLARRSWLI